METTVRTQGVIATERRTKVRPALTLIQGPQLGEWFVLSGTSPSYVIGRDESASFRIEDRSVSRRHVQVSLEPSGSGDSPVVSVRDLGSRNGTHVNGRRIVARTLLSPGDKIQLGEVVLRFDLLDPIDMSYVGRIREKLRSAELDALTGLLGRRFFTEELPGLVADWSRRGLEIALLILDVDDFKRVNDTFGHTLGDRVLERIGAAVQSQIRRPDVAVRYGGDELVVVLPGVAAADAGRVARRIAQTIRSLDWTDVGEGLAVTVSIGVAMLEPEEGVDQAFDRADRALLAAKAAGRDRVAWGGEGLGEHDDPSDTHAMVVNVVHDPTSGPRLVVN